MLECLVEKVIDKGVIVTLPYGLEGFVPNSKIKLADDDGNKKQPAEGETHLFRILEYDRNNKKVILATPERVSDEQKAVAEFKTTRPAPTGAGGSMADAFLKAGFGDDAPAPAPKEDKTDEDEKTE